MNLEREMVYCDRETEKDGKTAFCNAPVCVFIEQWNSYVIAIGHCQGAGQEQAL